MDLHQQNFVIVSDSQQAVNDIIKGTKGSYGAIINEIKLQVSFFTCNFTFKSHVVNYEAHSLAKHALSLDHGRYISFDQPHTTRKNLIHRILPAAWFKQPATATQQQRALEKLATDIQVAVVRQSNSTLLLQLPRRCLQTRYSSSTVSLSALLLMYFSSSALS